MESHPLWVCGLKSKDNSGNILNGTVTPFMGVWIEISMGVMRMLVGQSHTLYGCVD